MNSTVINHKWGLQSCQKLFSQTFKYYIMTTVSLITSLLSVLMAAAAMTAAVKLRRSRAKAKNLETLLKEAEKEKSSLGQQLLQSQKKDGLSEKTVLTIAGDIARIENNLEHMQDVPGRKQIAKAIERIKAYLKAEDYVIEPLLGKPYTEGMLMTATFLQDDSIPYGTSVITSVQKPQVNHAGRMIQAAIVTVKQNI